MTNGAVALLRKRWALLKAYVEAMEYSAADHTNDRVGRLERDVEHLKDELRWTRMSAAGADCGFFRRQGQQPGRQQATEVPKRDMEVCEGDHLDLGDQHLVFHTAPGHTPGDAAYPQR